MYCIDCNYDLRGQAGPNCPNCGRGFDPADSDSFFGDRAGSFTRRRGWRRPALIAAWTAVPVLAMIGLPTLTDCRGPQYWFESYKNLQAVVAEWAASGVHPSQPGANYACRVPPGVSRLSQAPIILERLRFVKAASRKIAPVGFLLFVYSAVMIVATFGWARRVFVGLTGLGALTVAVCGEIGAEKVAARIYPGDASYVDDFVYLDWSWGKRDPHDSKFVVAYEREPLNGVRRIVAFSSGLIGNLPEADFASMELAPPYESNAPAEAVEGSD